MWKKGSGFLYAIIVMETCALRCVFRDISFGWRTNLHSSYSMYITRGGMGARRYGATRYSSHNASVYSMDSSALPILSALTGPEFRYQLLAYRVSLVHA